MKKFMKIIILLISLTLLTINVSAKDIEYEPKMFYNYAFPTPVEDQIKKNIINKTVPAGINSKVPVLIDNSYLTELKDNFQYVTDKDNFELRYSISPVIANSNPKEQVMCFSNLTTKNIDDRYYAVPYFEFAPINPAGIIQAGNLKAIENKYQIIPGEALLTDINYKSEDSYKYYEIKDGVIVELNKTGLNAGTIFKNCILYDYSKLSNNNAEGIDIVLSVKNENGLRDAFNIISRSYFGNDDVPKINLEQENKKIREILSTPKTNPAPKSNQNIIAFIVLVAFLVLVFYLLLKKFQSKK